MSRYKSAVLTQGWYGQEMVPIEDLQNTGWSRDYGSESTDDAYPSLDEGWRDWDIYTRWAEDSHLGSAVLQLKLTDVRAPPDPATMFLRVIWVPHTPTLTATLQIFEGDSYRVQVIDDDIRTEPEVHKFPIDLSAISSWGDVSIKLWHSGNFDGSNLRIATLSIDVT